MSCEGKGKESTDFICSSQEGEAASPDGGLASCYVRGYQMNTHAHVFPGRSSQVATPVTVDEQQRNFGLGCDIAQYRVCRFCCRRKSAFSPWTRHCDNSRRVNWIVLGQLNWHSSFIFERRMVFAPTGVGGANCRCYPLLARCCFSTKGVDQPSLSDERNVFKNHKNKSILL